MAMSNDLLFFDADGAVAPPRGSANPFIQDAITTLSKPEDDCSATLLIPGTIFYLTITTPHADTWTYHGPVSTFAALIPLIEKAISHCPTAVRKWKKLVRDSEEDDEEEDWVDDGWGNLVLQEKGPTFLERGFTTFVFEHELDGYELPGEFTILSIIREINGNVLSILPGPVFTVSSHGPLNHDMGTYIYALHSGRPKSLAATSKIIGSYNTAAEAKVAAHRVMDHLLKDEEGVRRTENWEGLGTGKGKYMGKNRGVGRGLLMAMDAARMWEVKIEYESDVLGGAVARFDCDERNVLRGRKAMWRA